MTRTPKDRQRDRQQAPGRRKVSRRRRAPEILGPFMPPIFGSTRQLVQAMAMAVKAVGGVEPMRDSLRRVADNEQFWMLIHRLTETEVTSDALHEQIEAHAKEMFASPPTIETPRRGRPPGSKNKK